MVVSHHEKAQEMIREGLAPLICHFTPKTTLGFMSFTATNSAGRTVFSSERLVPLFYANRRALRLFICKVRRDLLAKGLELDKWNDSVSLQDLGNWSERLGSKRNSPSR
jgi:hypothetical protein